MKMKTMMMMSNKWGRSTQEQQITKVCHNELAPWLESVAKACALLLLAVVATAFVLSLGQGLCGRRGSAATEKLLSEFLRLGLHSNATIAGHLRHLTAEPHVAGSRENMAAAEYILSCFRKYGLSAHSRDYDVLLTFPQRRSLVLHPPSGAAAPPMQVPMRERVLAADPYTRQARAVVPGFHAYSPSGAVTGPAVYAHYGRRQDLALLEGMGVTVHGSIVVARHGRIFRGDIVKNAAAAGAVAVLTYSDPADYGGADGKSYPESKWLPGSGVQRGTVVDFSGDLLTPGWPATADAERVPESDVAALVFPSVPSLPISAEDALMILRSLGGAAAPAEWDDGGLPLRPYRVGPGPSVLNFTYVANRTVSTIRNVVAVVEGREEPDRYVLLGNHRDAWTFGAVDPNSGTAALLDIAERLGKLLKQGWRPRRSIVLCSWDAEEYGSIGSTEWVEENFDLLHSRAVAYINVDCAVAGEGFMASATPQLDNVVRDVTRRVADPDNESQTLYEAWAGLAISSNESPIGRLGGWGSDYSAFLHHVGVPAMDIYFGKDYPVYHSLYDNYLWMEKFGDPLFSRHVAVAGVWGLVALRVAQELHLPFDYRNYADSIKEYVDEVETQIQGLPISTSPLRRSLARLTEAVTKVESDRDTEQSPFAARSLNDRLMMAERALTDPDGIPGRKWHRHLIYGPSSGSNDYGSSSFPAIAHFLQKCIESESNATLYWGPLQHHIWKVSRALDRAARVLSGQLS